MAATHRTHRRWMSVVQRATAAGEPMAVVRQMANWEVRGLLPSRRKHFCSMAGFRLACHRIEIVKGKNG